MNPNIKVKSLTLIYFFICTPCLEPTAIQNIPTFKLLFNAWRVMAFLMLIVYALYVGYKPSKLLKLESIFLALLGIATIRSDGEISSCISTSLAILTITVIAEIGVKKDIKLFLKVLSITYIINLSIDCFQYFSGIGLNALKNTAWMGLDNFAIFAILPMLGVILVSSYIQKNRITPFYFIVVACGVAAKFYTFAGTSMIALTVWGVLILGFNRVSCTNKVKWLLGFIGIGIIVLVSFNFADIFMAMHHLLGKNPALEHSRIAIWKYSIQAILHKPILGYGVMGGVEESIIIVGSNWNTFSHTHNYILELAFRSGMIGALVYMIMLRDAARFVLRDTGYCPVNIVRATLVAQVILWITDSYYALTPFYVLLVLAANHEYLKEVAPYYKRKSYKVRI